LTTTNREIIPLVYQHNNIIQAFYYKKSISPVLKYNSERILRRLPYGRRQSTAVRQQIPCSLLQGSSISPCLISRHLVKVVFSIFMIPLVNQPPPVELVVWGRPLKRAILNNL